MKKAFTLIELLIVVVVLVTLMMIAFKLGNIGEEARARTVTIERIQRLENALSGYNAAFGMYPPVRIHGSRNIYLRVDDNGLQNSDGEENTAIWGWCSSNGEVTNWKAEGEAWRQVEAACRSQPVACEFPFDNKYQDMIQAACEELQTWAEQSECMPDSIRQMAQQGFDDGVTENIGRHAKNKGKIEWSDIQLFKFGALSYLLPRYLIMMNGDPTFFTDYAQWTGNNQEPCDPLTGGPMGWSQVQNYALSDSNSDLAHVANAPSQAVCARWMANFEGGAGVQSRHNAFRSEH